jgi:hypothetical protein
MLVTKYLSKLLVEDGQLAIPVQSSIRRIVVQWDKGRNVGRC